MNSVDVHEFFQHFKGCYKGEAYDSTLPPRRVFLNHPSRKPFVMFISAKLLDRLFTGAISLWGKGWGGSTATPSYATNRGTLQATFMQ